MKKREMISIPVPKPQKNVAVYRAQSFVNEIRFYLNDDYYFTAIESKNGYSVKLAKEGDDKLHNKNNRLKMIALLTLYIVIMIIAIYFCIRINRFIFTFTYITIVRLVLYFFCIFSQEFVCTSSSTKSKHTAEHKMVNFLEQNNRLPRSLDEVKKCSRFNANCGSRYLIVSFKKELVCTVFAILASFIVSVLFFSLSYNILIIDIAFISMYFIAYKLTVIAINRCLLGFILKPLEKALSYIIQCANTTRKVKDTDIILAYASAKEWFFVIYPNLYKKSDCDSFEQSIKVNHSK